MFPSHKSFFCFFFLKKRKGKKITVSLTQNMTGLLQRTSKHGLLIGIVLSHELLNFALAFSLPWRVQRFEKETTVWDLVNIHDKIDTALAVVSDVNFVHYFIYYIHTGIYSIHEDIQHISNLDLYLFVFFFLTVLHSMFI